jgi:hypothetical protein
MEIRYYIESDSGLPHIYSHGVREDEVEEVLERPGEDRPGRERSRVAIGQTRVGRIPAGNLYAGRRRIGYFRHYRFRFARQATGGVPSTNEAETTMKKQQNRFPMGWDEKKVRRVLRHYETQTAVEAAAEDAGAYKNRRETFVAVPVRLLPMVRKLIARRAG